MHADHPSSRHRQIKSNWPLVDKVLALFIPEHLRPADTVSKYTDIHTAWPSPPPLAGASYLCASST